jgi:hypothetical protein
MEVGGGGVQDEEEVIRPCYVFEGFDECIQNCSKKTRKGSLRIYRCRWGEVLNLVQTGCEDMIPLSTARGKGMQSCRWCVVCSESNHCSDVTIKLHTQKLICLLFLDDEKIYRPINTTLLESNVVINRSGVFVTS